MREVANAEGGYGEPWDLVLPVTICTGKIEASYQPGFIIVRQVVRYVERRFLLDSILLLHRPFSA